MSAFLILQALEQKQIENVLLGKAVKNVRTSWECWLRLQMSDVSWLSKVNRFKNVGWKPSTNGNLETSLENTFVVWKRIVHLLLYLYPHAKVGM
jgi:hypothetical protein